MPKKYTTYPTPKEPRYGQIAAAWGLFRYGTLLDLYERHKDAAADADLECNITQVSMVYGLDGRWHVLRDPSRTPRPRKRSKTTRRREIVQKARNKLTQEELDALGI